MSFGYPRVPHLKPGRGTRDDLVLGAAQVRSMLAREVVVEEKIDGANVSVWWDGGWIQCALRSGEGAIDRGGQLGPLRAYLAEHAERLRPLFVGDRTLIAEWMWFSHGIVYDALPAWLMGLDLVQANGRWCGVDERDELFDRVGVVGPPVLHRGGVNGLAALEAMVVTSAFSSELMEGVVVRPVNESEPRVAKLVRSGFQRLADERWGRRNSCAATSPDTRFTGEPSESREVFEQRLTEIIEQHREILDRLAET
jgi:hypothetical protein